MPKPMLLPFKCSLLPYSAVTVPLPPHPPVPLYNPLFHPWNSHCVFSDCSVFSFYLLFRFPLKEECFCETFLCIFAFVLNHMCEVFLCVSQLSVAVIKYLEHQLKGGEIYFDSWFQRFQSIATWLCCFWTCDDGGSMWWSKVTHVMAVREQRGRRGKGWVL
jgi:hypothetical protein